MTVDNVIGTDTNLQATDVAAMMEMMKNIMDRMTRQHEPNKLTNECLPEITTVITPPAAYDDNPATVRRQLFRTKNPTAWGANQATRKITNLQSLMVDINSKIHKVTSSAPEIESALAAPLNLPSPKKSQTSRFIKQTSCVSHPI